MELDRPSSDGLPYEPFAVELQRNGDLVVVQPRGELDAATIPELRGALDAIENFARLVLDLRGLSFIDSTGLHLLVELHERAQNDRFELTLIAPEPPLDKAIRLCGLDGTLPFAPAAFAVDSAPAA